MKAVIDELSKRRDELWDQVEREGQYSSPGLAGRASGLNEAIELIKLSGLQQSVTTEGGDVLAVLREIWAGLQKGDLMADPTIIKSGRLGWYTQLLNRICIALAKVDGEVK